MDENTLKEIWLDAGGAQEVEIDIEKLLEIVRRKTSKLERTVRRRDRREIGAALLIIPIFLWKLVTYPKIQGKIGAGIIVATALYYIYWIIRAKKVDVYKNYPLTIRYDLLVSLKRVRKQIKLLNTVLLILLPLMTGILCLYYSFPLPLNNKIIYTLAVVLLVVVIYYLNKRVVRKVLRPLENTLEKFLDELTEETK